MSRGFDWEKARRRERHRDAAATEGAQRAVRTPQRRTGAGTRCWKCKHPVQQGHRFARRTLVTGIAVYLHPKCAAWFDTHIGAQASDPERVL